ncbi:leishmanolysin family protein (macronuclear) [Tetrahymena thermophila SB210]|uniref:Leishmanolysin family protein n=1 Tax=Tetrahymena thermophila (strain SB210) TaxID=312017 RepID=W7X749_TETTS|nr:leishmanolysin family protein [Tetrahymena thermophila SB210]EWS75215.1 leishmanolysin family protein [Tetrahymena thermophila SB210]|eukprot:XP_012652206.1 leishmanolysin family protein [Tetrahymena thermophila SB210]
MLKQTSAHLYGHACQHDSSILEKIMPQEYYDSIEEISLKRKLAGGTPQPFRVTIDPSYLDDPANGSGMDSTKKNYIIKIMNTAQMFLKNFIKVIPRTTPIKKRGSATCYDINVPAALQSTGVSNSDLHILVTFENTPSSSALANAVACDYDPGPIVGRIKFNIGTMKNIGTTTQAFESDFATAIHELTHVLGFSSSAMQYWIDPDTNQPYLANVGKIQVKDTVRGVSNVIKLKSKNVLDTARRYYNCPSLDSVPLENQGGSGSFGSHWERDLIQNEYMTASAILGHAIISEFTAALLVDTGFYAEINSNMVEKGYWGRGKGCDFINKSCDDTNQQYPEFSYDNKVKCDFYSVGYGTLASDQFSQCKVIQDYSNGQCFDDTQMAPNIITRNNSGSGSKCFISTSLDKRYNISGDNGIRCHKYTCNADNSAISVNLWKDASLNIQINCSSQNQVIDLTTVSADTKGSLTCPADFSLFCSFPKSCINFCSGNGICSNAVCYCLDGFAGEDCSKSCPSPQVWDGTQCVLNCTGTSFLNPDNTCKPTCPKAYFKNTNKNTCDICNKACSICTDSSNSSCSECNSPYVLKGTTCQDPSAVITCDSTCLTCSGSANNQCLTCSDGRFLDSQNQCTLCQSPCKNCTDSATKCTSCITDYTFNSSTNTCSPICDLSCLTCSSPKDATKCLSCSDGYFLSSGKCQQCSSPCSKCVDSASKCLSCITNYTFDNPSNSCKPNCDSSCKTCSQPIDQNNCLSCNDGSFLDGTKCSPCSSPCKTCDSSSTKCLSCIANYTYDNTKNICNPVCDSSCKNCSKPNDLNSCTSCNDGSFLDGSKCSPCTLPCKTCDTSSTKCLSCITDYTYDSSNNQCNPNCDASCKTCSKPKDPNSCLSCSDGSFLDGAKCSICTSPCKTCDSLSTKCFSCVANYTYDSSKNTCSPICDSSCKNCSKPNDPNACTSCNDGSFLDGNKCTVCTPPCKTCDTQATKCLSCITDYTYDSSKNQCNPDCDISCKTCQKPKDANQCLSCNDGAFLDGTKCTLCTSPCKTCDTLSTKCSSCVTNYTYDNSKNQCNPDCDASCKTCSNPKDANQCLSCNDGAFLDGTKCTLCTPPCKTCDTSSSKCLSCIPSYQLDNSNNKCNPTCDVSCKTCSQPIDPNSCLSCNDGFFLDGTKCSACSSPCKTCDSSSTKCLSCVANYTYDSSKNTCSPICDSSCKNCSKPNDPNACTSCNDGSFLDGNKCTVCTSPCKTCDTQATKCLSCITDYTYDSSKNQCNPDCDISCKTCSKPKDANQCLSCNDGAFLDGTKCTLCTSPCKTCDTLSTKCSSCVTNYTYDNSKNQCNPDCDISCKTCSKPKDANQCLNCNDGAFLDGTKCTLCTLPCKTCDTVSTKCSSCVTNYTYDSSKNQCNPDCDASCKTCSNPKDANQCLSCNDGAFLDGTKCTLCTPPCKTCDTSSSKCLSCIPSYQLDNSNNKCNPTCDVSCKTCSQPIDPNSCLSCNDGFFLDGTKCSACSSPCKTCDSSSTKCLSCVANYTYDSSKNTCSPICDSSCKNCSKPNDPNACTSCNDGSFLDGNKCTVCTSPCKTCDTQATKCLSCVTDYTYDSSKNQCNPDCDISCKTCSKPKDANQCLSCNDGAFLDGTKCTLCTSPCKTCDTLSTKCSSCVTNYTYDNSKNQCNPDCDISCKTCSKPKDANQCLSCNDGAFLDGTKCTLCTLPCKTCDTISTKCSSCVTNYTYDSSKNQCNPDCDASCKTCSNPKDANQCLSCNDGAFLDGTKCTLCTPPCKTCDTSSSKCLSCIPSYQLDNSNNKCNPTCDVSCKTCSQPIDPNSCLSCNDGFFLDGTKCSACSSPCKTCDSSSTKCLSCVANYTYDSSKNTCSPICDSSCKNCSKPNDPNACTSCNDGSFLDGNKCTVCTSPCKTCDTQATKCLSCITDYTYDSSKNQCNPDCDISCKTCSKPKDANQCLSCNDGAFLDGTKCTLCTLPCKTCDTVSTKCSSCVTNYTYDNSKNQCNPDCDSSCKSCVAPKDPTKCQECNKGSYLSSGQCLKCNSSCNECVDNDSKCTSCLPDYSFDSLKNICTPICDSSCKTCLYPKDSTKCTSCQDGSFLFNGKCSPCKLPCSTCENKEDQCLSCQINYTFDHVNKICQADCDSSCKTCSSPKDSNSCLSCQDGYFLSGKQCIPCSSPCKTCNVSSTTCLSCISDTDYQYKSASNKCEPICDLSCLTCSEPKNPFKCISCNDGTYLNSNQCQKCQAPCLTCQNLSTQCLSCIDSKYTYDSTTNTCKSICHASCKTCTNPDDANACSSCFDGSFLNGSTCQQCQAPCQNCQNTGSNCLSCIAGYQFKSSNTCEIICSSSCQSCSKPLDDKSCTSCSDGYFLSGTQCLPCQAPCQNCVDSANKCLSCISQTDYKFVVSNNSCQMICDSTCKTCSEPNNPLKCQDCLDGSYLLNGECKKCTSPCGNCQTSPSKCFSCISSDYTLNASSNTCEPVCDSSCKLCSSPKDSSKCTTCQDGFYFDGGFCKKCSLPCSKCIDNDQKCTQCIDNVNYKFDAPTNKCIKQCHSSCKDCSDPQDISKCISCNDGFYLDSGYCKKCTSPCNTCKNSSECLTCQSGYTLDISSNQCQPQCDSSCLTCSKPNDANSCQSCKDGSFLNNLSQCLSCKSPCSKCNGSADKCTACITNYNLNNSLQQCSPICDSSCKTCSEAKDASKCLSCNDGFYLDSGMCKKCISPCSNCKNSTQCLTCETGYTLDVASSQCLPQCDSSCLTCSKPNDANSCLSCKDGSFLNGLSQCQPCKSPCSKCNGLADKCTACITNYNLNISLQSCSPVCDSSCKTCSEAQDASKCLSCQDGFFLISNTCQKCKQPCQTCQDQADKCLSCISNDFKYDALQFKCTSSCHSSCKTCTGPSQSNCTSCFDSFYLDNNQCQTCLSPCDNCSISQDNCTSCINGYNLNSNKCEIICDSSCQTCSAPKSPNSCTSCKDGFYLDKGQCKPCQSPCSKCSSSETQCTDCISNYKLASNQCIPICDKSCKNCSKPIDSNFCLSCFDGYYLSGSQCLKCNSPCETCETNSSKCLTCQTGYQLSLKNPNTCEPSCDSSCLTCSSNSNPNACLSCPDGRYLESNQCKLCPVNCLTCSSISKCESCKLNYGLDLKTGSCQLICDKSCLSCSLPNNPKACLSCTSNKILIDGSCQDCPQGQYFNLNQCSKCSSNCKICKDSNTCNICEDGYSLDSNKSCKENSQSYKCHYTCNTCLGTLYSHCTSCAGNRVLNNKSDKTKASQIVGTCDCPSGTSDFNQPFCDQSKMQESIKTTETAFLISSGSTTTVLAIVSANPLILGSLIEFSQTISFFTYINEKPALGFDDVAQNLYIAHITKIFNFDGMRKNKSSRLLQSTSSQNQLGEQGFNNNSKIPLNDKYPEFVVNALAILVLTGLAWLLSALTSIITIQDPNSFTAKIKKIFCISFTICIFVLTSQEFSLLIFFQFQQLGMENQIDTASAFLSFIVFAYILGFLGYLFYKLNYQQVLTKPMFIAQSALKTSAKVHPIFGVDISQAKEEKTITNPDYYTFYILHLYIKQNSFLNRAFIQIIVIRKIITSVIMTFGYQNPITQVSILLALYFMYWLYIILSRPFKEVKHMILYSVIETITLSMYILYLILLNNESDNEKQKTISLVMLILILVALLFYLLVSFIYLVLFAVQCLKKCGDKQNDIAVVNISNHFEKDQSNAQFNQQPIQESKIYTKPLDMSYNPNSQQHKIVSYVQHDKMNCSVTNNQSIIQENQNLSKQIISDTVFLESPDRSKQNINIIQQQPQQDNINTTNRIRLIQGYQIDKLQPQDDILPEKISQSKIPDVFNEPLNYSRARKARKFQDIF